MERLGVVRHFFPFLLLLELLLLFLLLLLLGWLTMCTNKLSRRIIEVGAAKQLEQQAERLHEEFRILKICFLLSDLMETL